MGGGGGEERGAPALHDLSQDIAGPFPPDLIRAWLKGPGSEAHADELLAPFRRHATVVASDCSGLTRLTERRDVLEVQALVCRVKQVVHAVGLAAGGRAPGGAWIADNTEMIYAEEIPTARVLEAAFEIHAQLEGTGLRAGLAIHHGVFYELGGGLYGDDATLVEELAEEHAGPGETLLTAAAEGRAGGGEELLREAREVALTDAAGRIRVAVVRPRQAPPRRPLQLGGPEGLSYPLPFARSFHEALLGLGSRAGPAIETLHRRYGAERVVVFVELGPPPTGRPRQILETAVRYAAFARDVERLAPAGAEVVENGGGAALLAFAKADEALDFALAAIREAAELGLPARLGLERGPVLVVGEEAAGPAAGRVRLAGHTVHLASKLVHELGRPGTLQIGEAAAAGLAPERLAHGTRHVRTVSGVELRWISLEPR